MKVNLSTPPESVIRTLEEEHKMACQAYIEHHGGAELYDKWQDEQLEKINRLRKSYIGPKFLWESPSGNKWCVFENCQWVEDMYPHTQNCYFCYYETVPYAGMFLYSTVLNPATGGRESCVLLYESHFFERCVERGLLDWKGIDSLIDFRVNNPNVAAYSINPEEHRIDVRLDKCIGRGFYDKKLSMRYIRIKTILSDEQLTNNQRKTTMVGRRWGDAMKPFMGDDAVERITARAVKSMQEGKSEEFHDEYIRDFARANMMSVDDADMLFKTFSCVFVILGKIRPSIIEVLYNPLEKTNEKREALDKVEDVLREWGNTHDNDVFKNKFVDVIIEFSMTFGRKVTRQSVLRVMYEQEQLSKSKKNEQIRH